MTRVALYARYSSDNQREASIVDQFRLCDEHARREGWQVAVRAFPWLYLVRDLGISAQG